MDKEKKITKIIKCIYLKIKQYAKEIPVNRDVCEYAINLVKKYLPNCSNYVLFKFKTYANCICVINQSKKVIKSELNNYNGKCEIDEDLFNIEKI